MAVVLKKASEFATEPFDAGDGKLNLVDVIAQPEQAPVSAGIAEIWESAPIEFDYDNDCAVCYMLESRVTVTGRGHAAGLRAWRRGLRAAARGLEGLLGHGFVREVLLVTYPPWR